MPTSNEREREINAEKEKVRLVSLSLCAWCRAPTDNLRGHCSDDPEARYPSFKRALEIVVLREAGPPRAYALSPPRQGPLLRPRK